MPRVCLLLFGLLSACARTGVSTCSPGEVCTPVAGVGGAAGAGGEGGVGGSDASVDARDSGGTGGQATTCGVVAYERPVDVLLVVDNSGSMREEQESLRVQVPRLVEALTKGIASDGTEFKPVKDLHVGVVSTDMGLPNVPDRLALGCGDESRPFGDDGILRNAPNPGGNPGVACQESFPMFLSYSRTGNISTDERAVTQLGRDIGCVSSLGTVGCGFEMPLEAGLRALWPSDGMTLGGALASFADGRKFLDGTMFGKAGPGAPNADFQRADSTAASLLVIVFLTDEEDCSSHAMNHFVPERFLPDSDPLKRVALNLRCFNEARRNGDFPRGEQLRDDGQANLFATTRYAQAFKALRPERPDLIFYTVIAGVPVDLVNDAARARIDFRDPGQRDAYYDGLLADERMREAEDPVLDANGNPNLVPACSRSAPGSTTLQRAFPSRRMIKVAKEIGENTLVQSICQDDFTPAIDAVLSRIGEIIRNECR